VYDGVSDVVVEDDSSSSLLPVDVGEDEPVVLGFDPVDEGIEV